MSGFTISNIRDTIKNDDADGDGDDDYNWDAIDGWEELE